MVSFSIALLNTLLALTPLASIDRLIPWVRNLLVTVELTLLIVSMVTSNRVSGGIQKKILVIFLPSSVTAST